MAKSFEVIFGADGKVIIQNIQGIEDSACVDFTKSYIDNMSSKDNPPETVMLSEQEEQDIINQLNITNG